MMRTVSRLEELNIVVRAPNDANGSIAVIAPNDANGCTARSSHVEEDGRMALAPLVNTQKTSYRQNAHGYDAPSRVGQGHKRCQDQVK